MKHTLFSYTRFSGAVLEETFQDGSWYLTYTDPKGYKTLNNGAPDNNTPGNSALGNSALGNSALGSRTLHAYSVTEAPQQERSNLWFGHDPRRILDSGRDIMGEALIADGDPDINAVRECLPQITLGAYCFLGGENSQGSLIIDTQGKVFPQISDRDREPRHLFQPVNADETLGMLTPRQYLLDDRLPLLYNIFSDNGHTMELLYFVEPGDVCRTPTLWIRVRKYSISDPVNTISTEYRIVTSSRERTETEMFYCQIPEELFLSCLADTVAFWLKTSEQGTVMQLPDKTLSDVATGAMLSLLSTFTAERPHYGHKFYGRELHDNFPPNLIWSIEACCLMGRTAMAKRFFDNMLLHILNDEDCICYRQGAGMNPGAAAAEYGQLLYLAYKYRRQLGLMALTAVSSVAVAAPGCTSSVKDCTSSVEDCTFSMADHTTSEAGHTFSKACLTWDTADNALKLERLCGMGRIILSHFVECPEFGGRKLIKMCAEADNNGRINVYLSNNLWSIRGLQALSELLTVLGVEDTDGFGDAAALLLQNINALLAEESIRDDRFGLLPPFRFGYTAAPLTLSNCLDTFSPVSEEELYRYFHAPRRRDDMGIGTQDLTENAYANYRYYPESLSTMLLSAEAADGIVTLRENLGGEILGMIHFRDWLDDWPVMHYARFLLESGRIEKYLLLLYAHTLHHGRPDLMCYYEQVRITGEVKAVDCVPSLLTTPLMLGWMFAYETMKDGRLLLLSALPKEWYTKPFSATRLGYSSGIVNISSDGQLITLDFSAPCPEGTELVYRAADLLTSESIRSGAEYVASIRGNRILLKPGIRYAQLEIR